MKDIFKNYYGPLVACILILAFVLYVVTDSQKIREYHKDLEYMDEYINIKLYTKSPRKARTALKEIDAIYKKYNKFINRTKAFNDMENLYTIHTSKVKSMDIVLDKDLYEMINFGIKIYEPSEKYIDINSGDIIDIWNAQQNSKEKDPNAYNIVGENKQTIDLLGNNSIRNNHVNIDLSTVQKGFVSDKVKRYLDDLDIAAYLINTGGIIIAGNHYEGKEYTIGLEKPLTAHQYYKQIKVKNKSVATKSIGDQTPVLNPKTNQREKKIGAVTVISDNPTRSDTIASILMMLDEIEGDAFLKQHTSKDTKQSNIQVIWYTNEGKIIDKTYSSLNFL